MNESTRNSCLIYETELREHCLFTDKHETMKLPYFNVSNNHYKESLRVHLNILPSKKALYLCTAVLK